MIEETQLLTWEVPGDDLTDDTKWLVHRVRDLVLCCLDRVSVDLVRPTRVVPQRRNRARDVGAHRPAESLTDVERLERRELVCTLLQEIRELVQQPSAFKTGAVESPDSVKRLLRAFDCVVHVLRCPLRHARDELPVRRVDDAESDAQ